MWGSSEFATKIFCEFYSETLEDEILKSGAAELAWFITCKHTTDSRTLYVQQLHIQRTCMEDPGEYAGKEDLKCIELSAKRFHYCRILFFGHLYSHQCTSIKFILGG